LRAKPPASPTGSLQQTCAVWHCSELVHDVTCPPPQLATLATQPYVVIGRPPASEMAVVAQHDSPT
jgi:hypothetical protein